MLYLAAAVLWIVLALLFALAFGHAVRERDHRDVSRVGAVEGEDAARPGSPTCVRCGAEALVWCLCRRALCARCATVHVPVCERYRAHVDEVRP